jgi:hypothetical protein
MFSMSRRMYRLRLTSSAHSMSQPPDRYVASHSSSSGASSSAPCAVFPRPATAVDKHAPLAPPSPPPYLSQTARPSALLSPWLSSAFTEGDLTHDSEFEGGDENEDINELYLDRLEEGRLDIDADEVWLLCNIYLCVLTMPRLQRTWYAKRSQPLASISEVEARHQHVWHLLPRGGELKRVLLICEFLHLHLHQVVPIQDLKRYPDLASPRSRQ